MTRMTRTKTILYVLVFYIISENDQELLVLADYEHHCLESATLTPDCEIQ